MSGYNIDVAVLAETRLSGKNQLSELDSDYTTFWSGKTEEKWREAGVGFVLKSFLLDKIERPVVLSGRIMSVKILLAGGRFLSLVLVYAPTLTA